MMLQHGAKSQIHKVNHILSQAIEVKRPRIRTEETRDADGDELATRNGHLMSDDTGAFPVGSLNNWEIEVLDQGDGAPGLPGLVSKSLSPVGRCFGRRLSE